MVENRILKGQIKGRILLSDAERKTLAELGKRLGKKALEESATIVKPETILRWHANGSPESSTDPRIEHAVADPGPSQNWSV